MRHDDVDIGPRLRDTWRKQKAGTMRDTGKIDAFYAKDRQWKDEMALLRKILLSTALTEEMKWHQPIYTFDGGNVAMPGAYKERCVLSFFKGSLLPDPDGILVAPGENTRGARVIPFHSIQEIEARRDLLVRYLEAAIVLETSGAKVTYEKDDLSPPEELTNALEADVALSEAFRALTPGRRRSWIMHIGQAKQSATRTARIDKARPHILAGKGLNGR